MRNASLPMSALMRLVMKPGDSRTVTVSLPMRSPTARAMSMAASSVSSARTISSRRMRGTGLKKCIPSTCGARCVTAAISVTDSDEVFEAR